MTDNNKSGFISVLVSTDEDERLTRRSWTSLRFPPKTVSPETPSVPKRGEGWTTQGEEETRGKEDRIRGEVFCR